MFYKFGKQWWNDQFSNKWNQLHIVDTYLQFLSVQKKLTITWKQYKMNIDLNVGNSEFDWDEIAENEKKTCNKIF